MVGKMHKYFEGMIQNMKAETKLYIHAFLVGLTGFLGTFYFIGCAGIVMFGEVRKYPYYMPFGEGMVEGHEELSSN